MADSKEDIALWPDGDWCLIGDIEEYNRKSDDYERIPFDSARWHAIMEQD